MTATQKAYLRSAEHEINKLHDALGTVDRLQVQLRMSSTPEDQAFYYESTVAIQERIKRRIIALGGNVQG